MVVGQNTNTARKLEPVPVSGWASLGGFDSTRSQNVSYLVGVDHVRCAAALLIVYYHGIQLFSSDVRHHRTFLPSDWQTFSDPVSTLLAEGHTAVALFITLSGFIFAFGAADREVSYRQFLTNRFLRTYPLLIFVVATGCAVHQRNVSLIPLLQTLLGGANLPGAQWLGNFSVMIWSVSLEWQLYLLFPALMALLNRSGAALFAGFIALVLAARGVAFLEGMDPVQGLYTQLFGRIDQFLLGMLAGWTYARHRRRAAFHHLLVPALVLVLAGAFAFNQSGGWPQPGWWKLATPTLEGVVWAGAILGHVAWTDRHGYRPGPISRAFAAVGATSYSIYLWHFVFIQMQRGQGWLPRLVEQPELNAALVVTLTTLPLTLAFAALSYQVVEKPFLTLRKRYVTRAERVEAHAVVAG